MESMMIDKSKEKQWLLKNKDAYKKYENWYYRRLTLIRRIRNFPPGLTCLDVGSGMGFFSIFLATNGFGVSAIEPDGELIERCKDNFKIMNISCNVKKGVAEEIPYNDNMFDGVFASSVLEHVADWKESLKEMTRVLKPGGILYVSTTNKQCPLQDEVNDFPLFSWIPLKYQQSYVQYCMAKKPDKINYTRYPVRYFFTYRQLCNELKKLNSVCYEPVDLYNRDYFPFWNKGLNYVTDMAMNSFVKWTLRFREKNITLYAQKVK